MVTKNLNLQNHPEAANSGNRYFNYNNRIPQEIVPRFDTKSPYQGPYDLTEGDLIGLAVYASTLLNKDLLRYNPVVASQDALNMAIRDKDNGRFDNKLNASTYGMVLAYLAEIQKPRISVESPFDLKKAKKLEKPVTPKKKEPPKETITLQKKRFPGRSEEVSKDELRKVLQGKPSKELTIHKKKELGIQASEETMNKYAAVTKQLDKIAASLEESQDQELLRLALELDRVSDELDGTTKEASALESDKEEGYMKQNFKGGVKESDKDEPFMKSFNTDTTQEVEKVKTQKGSIRKASLPYQKISE